MNLLNEQKQKIQSFLTKFPVEQIHIDDHFTIRSFRSILNYTTIINFLESKKNEQLSFNKEKCVPPQAIMRPEIEQFRTSLPTYYFREEILKTINTHQVTIITGGTGCGKTTQVNYFFN